MATHSSILAWRMPWAEKPGGLQFMGLQRVRHNCTYTDTHTHTHTIKSHERIYWHNARNYRFWDTQVSDKKEDFTYKQSYYMTIINCVQIMFGMCC